MWNGGWWKQRRGWGTAQGTQTQSAHHPCFQSLTFTFIMHGVEKVLKVLHGPKQGVDVPKILYVVPKVLHWRPVEGADPDGFDVEVIKVIQFLLDTWPWMEKGWVLQWAGTSFLNVAAFCRAAC